MPKKANASKYPKSLDELAKICRAPPSKNKHNQQLAKWRLRKTKRALIFERETSKQAKRADKAIKEL